MSAPTTLLVMAVLAFATVWFRISQFTDPMDERQQVHFPMNLPLHVILEVKSWAVSGILFLIGWTILSAAQV